MPIERYKYIALLLLIITIPLARLFNINAYAIAIFLVMNLFIRPRKVYSFRKSSFILFILYSGIIVLNLIFINQSDSIKSFTKFIPLIIIPFALLFVKHDKKILSVFLYTTIISCLICITHTYYISKGYIFFYHNPTEIIQIQSNYLSIFVCFSLCILYGSILEANIINLKHWAFILILFFSLAVFFNRASIIIAILITLIFALTYIAKHKNWKLMILFLAFFTISTVWILNRPIVKTKFQEIINTDYGNITDYNNGINSRILSWQCSLENIKDSGVWGLGISNSRGVLMNCYKNKAGVTSVPYQKKYNSHNLFLQTTLDLGFVGLGILILIYFYVLYVGITHRDYLTVSYFVVIFIFGLTESFLNRQWGIIFFAFFTPFLLNRHLQK